MVLSIRGIASQPRRRIARSFDYRYSMRRGAIFEELSPLFDDDNNNKNDEIGIGVTHGRRSSSYYRLPDPLLHLSVLKLDNTAFDVQVRSTANVRELRLAVEDVFENHPMEEEGIQISWSHVWSHFCLSCEDGKLIDDEVTLRSLRIKDGDQLCFVRHLSINYSPIKRQPRNQDILVKTHRRTMAAPEVLKTFEENCMTKDCIKVGRNQNADEKYHKYEEEEDAVGLKEFKLSHFLLRWFSCIGLQSSGRTRSEARTPLSRSGCNS